MASGVEKFPEFREITGIPGGYITVSKVVQQKNSQKQEVQQHEALLDLGLTPVKNIITNKLSNC